MCILHQLKLLILYTDYYQKSASRVEVVVAAHIYGPRSSNPELVMSFLFRGSASKALWQVQIWVQEPVSAFQCWTLMNWKKSRGVVVPQLSTMRPREQVMLLPTVGDSGVI